MSKTIKQIADELGVSKQAIHQRIKRNSTLKSRLQPFTSTVDGVVYIDVDGENIIKSLYGVNTNTGDVNDVCVNVDSGVCGSVDTLFMGQLEDLRKQNSLLTEQLSIKDEQLRNKDNQIANLQEQNKALIESLDKAQENNKSLTDALVAAQTLHAATIQTTALVDKSAEPERKGWKKIFRKKEDLK